MSGFYGFSRIIKLTITKKCNTFINRIFLFKDALDNVILHKPADLEISIKHDSDRSRVSCMALIGLTNARR